MGPLPEQPDRHAPLWQHLAAGGTLLAASSRAARACAAAYARQMASHGHAAWPTPRILDWETWLREQWQHTDETHLASRLLLSPLQERALWRRALASTPQGELLQMIPASAERMATLAFDAHALLCGYAPHTLEANTRASWNGDSAAFSQWLRSFDHLCQQESVLSTSRLPIELSRTGIADTAPLLLYGFDRLQPAQQALLNTHGNWKAAPLSPRATTLRHYAAPDQRRELTACAKWLASHLADNPEARLLVICPDIHSRRGEIERALLEHPFNSGIPFEFSLGTSLSRVAAPRAALLLLHFLQSEVEESELDWLISSETSAQNSAESTALAESMRSLRRRNLQRPRWSLNTLASAFPSTRAPQSLVWLERIQTARQQLTDAPRQQSPLAWSELTSNLLKTICWPGHRTLSSIEFQAIDRWHNLLDDCASLGFDGRRTSWLDFLSTLTSAFAETIFAPKSTDASVQIAGPYEAAGLTADALWFLSADEEQWPGRGTPSPLLPKSLTRDTGMPHATPAIDWELARAATNRLASSADEFIASFALQSGESECRPTRILTQMVGEATPLPADLTPAVTQAEDRTIAFFDTSRIAYTSERPAGGANTLTLQSLCPFQAFATTRLNADAWHPAESGLSPLERGNLLHAVMGNIWKQLTGLDDLRAVADLASFVRHHVDAVFDHQLSTAARDLLPARYLELERMRLSSLLSAWLTYESQRQPFTIAGIEDTRPITVAGLTLNLRLDRIDLLSDDSLLVIDYKTGNVGPAQWRGERPQDVQLPLYATFGLTPDADANPGAIGGLLFARMRTGELEFTGRARAAAEQIREDLARKQWAKDPLTDEELDTWRTRIATLATEYLEGRADVDPLEYPKTCKRCHLHTVCRIAENHALADEDDTLDDEDEADNHA